MRACARGVFGPRQRRARRLDPQAPHCDAGNDQFVGRPRCRRQRRGIEARKQAFGLVEAADQKQAADREIARMRGIGAVAVPFERACAVSSAFTGQLRSRETSAISASATTQRARATASRGPKARAARRSSSLGAGEIAELRHRDAAQRQRWRIVAQGDEVQRVERIARCERARRRGDQRVH